ncbi:MAG TPA: hypothetical protein VI455_07725 [Terriglobia bacterium]
MSAVRKVHRRFVVVILAALAVSSFGVPAARAADKPLTHDDVTLLLIGGASSQRLVDLIKQRGVGFQMTAELATEFRRDGADETVIQALEDASGKGSPAAAPAAPPASQSTAPATSPPTTPVVLATPAETPSVPAAPVGADGVSPSASAAPGPGPSPAPSKTQTTPLGPVLARHTAAAPTKPSAPSASSKGTSDLSDPSPEQIPQIIQAFAAKETLFKAARDNYTYHQTNKVQEVGADAEVLGQFQQDWDILYDDNGARIERVTYAPLPTLKTLQLTEQDFDAFRSIQPFVLTTAELPEYDVQYRGHVKVDQLTAYVFSLRPKQILKGKQYFQGMVWVDDRDLQIVKSEGKQVPEIKTKRGEENLFPRFTTWREQIDGKFWFPTFTLADDTLYFSSAPVHVKEIIRYTEYKQFKSAVKITDVAVVPPGGSGQQPQKQPDQKNPPKN